MVEFEKGSKLQYELILGTKTMNDLGIMLDFKTKAITIDEIILPMRNINLLQGASTLHVLKLNNSLAMEPKSTQDTTKCATQILDANYNKADLQSIIKGNCKHLRANQHKKLVQLLVKYESLFDGTLDDCVNNFQILCFARSIYLWGTYYWQIVVFEHCSQKHK